MPRIIYRDASQFGWKHGEEPVSLVTIEGESFVHTLTARLTKPMYPPIPSENRVFEYVAPSGAKLIVIEG